MAVERRTAAPVVDFEALRSKQFLGANIVAFMVSFGMLAMFFFLALYMQNILGYSALEAGVRFLPTTLVIIVAGPISGRLADRIGPRPLMVAGLLIVAASLVWQSRIEVDTSYGFLVGAFVLMGLGMGLVMSPMSMAAMNAVDRTKAGVASGTLSMFRMVGGTFGVAALGALVAVRRPPRPRAVAAVALRAGARRARRRPRLGRRARRRLAETVSRRAQRVRRRARHRPDRQLRALAAAAVVAWFLIAPGRARAGSAPRPAAEAEAELATRVAALRVERGRYGPVHPFEWHTPPPHGARLEPAADPQELVLHVARLLRPARELVRVLALRPAARSPSAAGASPAGSPA